MGDGFGVEDDVGLVDGLFVWDFFVVSLIFLFGCVFFLL